MNEARIKQLEEFIAEDPKDPFPKYALALEYLKGNAEKSAEVFKELLKDFPDYIGTYYHAAQLFAEIGDTALATEVYEKGIKKAKALNEAHALKELQSAYLNFQFEID